MKTNRHMGNVVFLVAVFYGVSSSSFRNQTEKEDLIIYPEGEALTIPSMDFFQLHCFVLRDYIRMAWIGPSGKEIPEGVSLAYLTNVIRSSSSVQLLIYMPQRVHSGKYTCLAEYNETLGTSNSSSIGKVEASINITVLDKPDISEFQNVTVAEGGTASLTCNGRSHPTPNITILKPNGLDVSEDEDDRIEVTYSLLSDRLRVTVNIRNVKPSDEGYYYCVAEANGFYANETAYLEVQFAPNLTATERQQLLPSSGTFTNLTCIAEANPPAAIRWEFQNKEIDPENQYNFTYGRTVISNLLINMNDTSDVLSNVVGIYKCIATNIIGSRSVDIALQKAVVPGEISQVLFDRVTPRSILFRFIGPSHDGGKRITAYVVNYSTPEDYHDSTVEWPVDSSYILKDLRPGANYEFKVAAKNSIGIGAWKTIHYVMPKDINDTTVEPNTLITTNVNITDYPDRYEIRWKVHDDYGMLKRYFVVTYFDDGRIKVEHQHGNTTFPL